jgi:hypothetical protein
MHRAFDVALRMQNPDGMSTPQCPSAVTPSSKRISHEDFASTSSRPMSSEFILRRFTRLSWKVCPGIDSLFTPMKTASPFSNNTHCIMP